MTFDPGGGYSDVKSYVGEVVPANLQEPNESPMTFGGMSVRVAAQDMSAEEEHELLKWHNDRCKLHDEQVEDMKVEHGESEFQVKGCLRSTILGAQRIDPNLNKIFTAKEMPQGFRRAEDGVLERHVAMPPPITSVWAVVLPDGHAAQHMSWKRWAFLQVHVGILGGHRGPQKTLNGLRRLVGWSTMAKDVEKWCNRCHTCQRFRKVAQKQVAPDVVRIDAECWERVMVDLEGPSTPADLDGCVYVMTYICQTRHAVLLNRSKKCNGSEVRRMFADCVFRSGTLPCMVNTDRGAEFKNLLKAEYTAIISRHRP